MDRFTRRGKGKVDVQWMLYRRVYNIEKNLHYGDMSKVAMAAG